MPYELHVWLNMTGPCAGLQGGSKHVTEEEAEKLWSLQQSFAAAVLGCKPLMKTARVQLRELLRSARYALMN